MIGRPYIRLGQNNCEREIVRCCKLKERSDSKNSNHGLELPGWLGAIRA